MGILLAAGGSRRFGSNKLAAPSGDGRAVGLRAAETLAACVEQMIVVVRPGDEVTKAIFVPHFQISECAQSVAGIGHSIAHGVLAYTQADRWLIALADMPYILPATIRETLDASHGATRITRPQYRAQAGHPVNFGAAYCQELCALGGDAGAQSIIDAHHDQLVLVPTADRGVVEDIDRPEHLERDKRTLT